MQRSAITWGMVGREAPLGPLAAARLLLLCWLVLERVIASRAAVWQAKPRANGRPTEASQRALFVGRIRGSIGPGRMRRLGACVGPRDRPTKEGRTTELYRVPGVFGVIQSDRPSLEWSNRAHGEQVGPNSRPVTQEAPTARLHRAEIIALVHRTECLNLTCGDAFQHSLLSNEAEQHASEPSSKRRDVRRPCMRRECQPLHFD